MALDRDGGGPVILLLRRLRDVFAANTGRYPDRATAVSRGSGAVAGARPRTKPRLRALLRSVNVWFWVIVGIPTLLAGVYYFAIASDLYLSEVKFLVRGKGQAASGALELNAVGPGRHVQSMATGGTAVSEDTHAVREYLMSRDAVRRLEQEADLRTLLTRPEADPISRFPGIRFWREDFESLFSTFGRFVSIDVDTNSGVATLDVKAYRPEDAQRIAHALMGFAEQLVNALNERARNDAVGVFRREVEAVEQRIDKIQTELTAYRVNEQMIDPVTAATGPIKLLAQISGQIIEAKSQLSEALQNAPSSPQIPLLRTRIAALEKLLIDERSKVTGENESLALALSEYERIEVQRLLAHKQLASVFASREQARIDADRQQLYLETIAQANLADYPLYPRRIISFALVTTGCFAVYGVIWLLFLRKHMPKRPARRPVMMSSDA